MATSLPIITVLNATGTQGTSVVRRVAEYGRYAIRALTRNPNSEKALELGKLANVTIMDSADLDAAFKSAFAVYAYGLGDETEVTAIKKAADAAAKAEVAAFIYSALPSIEKETSGKIKDVYHFEFKHEVEKYLETVKLHSIILYLANFTENFLKYGFLKYEKDEFTLTLNSADVSTELPMLYVERDLGNAVVLILDNCSNVSELWDSPIIVSSYKIPYGDHVDILESVSGRKVNPVITDTFTESKDTKFDVMRKYFDEYGFFKGHITPDPRLIALGFVPHTFEHYVRNEIMPAFNL